MKRYYEIIKPGEYHTILLEPLMGDIMPCKTSSMDGYAQIINGNVTALLGKNEIVCLDDELVNTITNAIKTAIASTVK